MVVAFNTCPEGIPGFISHFFVISLYLDFGTLWPRVSKEHRPIQWLNAVLRTSLVASLLSSLRAWLAIGRTFWSRVFHDGFQHYLNEAKDSVVGLSVAQPGLLIRFYVYIVSTSFLLLVAMPFATSSFLFLVVRPLLLVAMPFATTSFLFLVVRPLLLVAMPFATSSFLFLVVRPLLLVAMPFATSSFLFLVVRPLLLVAMPFATSSFLFLVVRPLLLVAMPFATSSFLFLVVRPLLLVAMPLLLLASCSW